jgi:hypothetical protein
MATKPTKPVTQDEILTAIRAEAKQTRGGRIRLKKFLARTNIDPADIYRHFASWNGAVAAAGFDCRQQKVYAEADELLKDWGTVARKLKRLPTYSTYNAQGKYSPATLQNRFVTWLGVREAFRTFAQGRSEWDDVLKFCPPLRLRRAAGHGRAHLQRRMRQRPAPAKPREDRPTFGEPVAGVPGLLNAPTNEAGVILIFGMLAERLGFQVRSLRAAFPDCIAMRWVGATSWQEVTIEFEFESRNFRAHRHPPDGCDILVCWTHNWEECPKHLEVIVLSEELERLREVAALP